MNLLSLLVLVMSGISIYVGCYYLFAYFFFKEKKEYLFFSLLCFSVFLYQFFAFWVYNSKSPLDAVKWQKFQFLSIPLSAIFLINCIYSLLEKKRGIVFYLLNIIFIPFIFFPFLQEKLFFSIENAYHRKYPVFGLEVDFYEAAPSILSSILMILLITVMVYIFVLFLLHYLRSRDKKHLIIMLSYGFFFLSIIFDSLTGFGIISFFYTVEYSFLFMILIMNYTFLTRFIKLNKEMALINVKLEEEVKKRTQEIMNLNEELKDTNLQLEKKISELKTIKINLENANNYLENITNSMNDILIVIDNQGRIIKLNLQALQIFKNKNEETVDFFIGKKITELLPDEEGLRNYVLKSTLNGKSISHYEINYEFYNGKVIPFSLSASPFRDSHNNITGSVLIIRDISNLKEMENNLRHLATHDVLTNLPNRFLFNDRAKQALMRAARYKNYVAFMLMDFDHFKEINDTMGHLVGDRLLREAAERIKKCLREYDTVARMGGDEFIVLVSDLKNEGETGLIAERILSSFKEAFYIDQNKIYFTPSIGISVFPANGDNIETLLKAADMAMYNAKSEGGNRFCYFSSSMKLILEEHSGIKMQLEEALKRREFVLYYQPLIDARMGNIVSAEALIRWKHPKLGLQEPLKFIPVAESTGYIVPIGEWVLSTAFRECKKWNSKGERISVCVNVSFKQLEDEEFVSKVKKTFEKTKLPPEYLIIEITESAAMHQEEMVIKNLKKINDLGIQIYIDDFGSGFSSLKLLKKLPISGLKIDNFFIQHITNDSSDLSIVKGIMAMAYNLNLKVILEGIETKEQFEYIKSLDWTYKGNIKCDFVQGFLFSEPLSPEEFFKKLQRLKFRETNLFL